MVLLPNHAFAAMEPAPTLPPQRPPPSPPPSPLAPAVEEGRQLDIEVLYVLFGIVMVLCGFFMYLQVVKRRRRKLIKAVEARDRERTEKRAMELQAQKSRVSVAVQSREERMSSESQRRPRPEKSRARAVKFSGARQASSSDVDLGGRHSARHSASRAGDLDAPSGERAHAAPGGRAPRREGGGVVGARWHAGCRAHRLGRS